MRQFSVLDFGVTPGAGVVTAAFQKLIDDVFLAGGGEIIVPAGTYLTGGLRLRSHITLHLLSGATLKGTRDPADYFVLQNDTLEPLPDDQRSDAHWLPMHQRKNSDHINLAGSSWNNALLRVWEAEDVAVLGEPGSALDGSDCFDETGEEHYRGPHAINMRRVKNLRLEGYTIQNSGNWAHALFNCDNVTIDRVTVLAGHDGVHLSDCRNVTVTNCTFETGDDCLAGFGNLNVYAQNCVFNTACSGMRFGGTNAYIEGCSFVGPGKYLFRGSLTPEEKRNSAPSVTADGTHRFNMLSAFTYYADHSRPVPREPGNIVLADCKIVNTDRLVHYNFSGNEPWQNSRPLASLRFQDVTAEGIRLPLNLYGDENLPIRASFERMTLTLHPDFDAKAVVHACHFAELCFTDVTVNGAPEHFIRRWSQSGRIVVERLSCSIPEADRIVDADEPFFAKAI